MVELSQILSRLEKFKDVKLLRKVEASPNTLIIGPKNIEEASPENICFLSQKYKNKVPELLTSCRASLVIVDDFLEIKLENLPSYYFIYSSPNAKKQFWK